MTPEQFISKWKAVELKERSASQSHFIDLCNMLDEPAPTDADPTGDWYAFERGASKTTGGEGWADVWKRGHFGWEYKGKRKDLNAAFAQLQQYALALENPPLLVVCDMDRFRIHTNWTNSISEVLEFDLDDLKDPTLRQKLKWVFSEPDRLKPGKTRQALTEHAAAEFSVLAQRLRQRGHPSDIVAHFINRLVFCMFAEDVDLLPNKMFKRLLEQAREAPENFEAMARALFGAMKDGGLVGFENVAWFNGGLFNDDLAVPLERDDIVLTLRAAELDWAEIDPSILGTLFERGLDPDKRSQLGAHYTDREKIMLIVNPVIVHPLLSEWAIAKAQVARHMSVVAEARERRPAKQSDARRVHAAARRAEEAALKAANTAYLAFLDRLRRFRVLDPACGSGNFLYLALTELKNIEHRANIEAELLGMTRQAPSVGPECVLGIEINSYAAELARVSVWIGEIQWMRRNGFDVSRSPILKPLNTIECRDAVLNQDGTEAIWPLADAVIGNPPFLGNKKMIETLGEEYTNRLRAAYAERLSGGVDLVVYWFLKTFEMIKSNPAHIAGLVATNSIRSGANREILTDIMAEANVFDAWSDEPWIVDGAAVRVSIVCFGSNRENSTMLNGVAVSRINADLTASSTNLTLCRKLNENLGVSFVGVILNGQFEVEGSLAREWLTEPPNVNGRPNADVLRPTLNGDDFNGERPDKWVIDFGTKRSERDAAYYQSPFSYIEQHVRPFRFRRKENGEFAVRAKGEREIWWRHARSRPAMRKALQHLSRYIAVPMVSSYRTVDYLNSSVLPDQKLVVFARDDDYFFGVLHSRLHELWTKRTCSWIGAGNDITYSNQSVFMTFPFPDGLTPNVTAARCAEDPRAQQVAEAARRLLELRDAWLFPPDLVKGEHEVVSGFPDRQVPMSDSMAALMKMRTLTNLYSEFPTWLRNAHDDLDAAVCAAYGWSPEISEDEALLQLFALNQSRAVAGEEMGDLDP